MKTSYDSETPAQGQQVLTATAFIHNIVDGQRKLFIPRRAKTKTFLPDIYELPGGHIDYGEEMVKGSHSIEVIYFASFIDPLDNIKLNPDDHSEFIWITENEIDRITSVNKNKDDQEFIEIKRGFKLLDGEELIFS